MGRPAFPTTIPSFHRMFPNDEACFRYLIDSRWPGDAVCPKCGGTKWYLRHEALATECAKCRKLVTATSGTVMHGSRQPLCHWLLAAWMLVTDKRGISATLLANDLGLRLETAWNMLHKLRAAMVDPDRTPLRGLVEVDETFIGGERKGMGPGPKRGAHEVVVGAVEVHGVRTPGRLRLRHIPFDLQRHLLAFLREGVEPGAIVRTDGSRAYVNLPKEGYRHEVESTARGMAQGEVLQTIHLAFSNLKTWLQGTFHGAVRKEHLQAYLNEFVFRFNRRGNLHAAFQTILGIAPKVEGPTYAGLYRGTFAHKNPKRRRRA